ncbi:MAG: hypothetical protein WCG14_01660 [Chlamydiia bacterium]
MISKVEWRKRIEAYKLSGLSTRAWCEIQNIPDSTFRYHLSTLKNQNQKKFIELKPTSQVIKLSWKNIILELDPDFDEKMLVRFLIVLR